MACSDEEELSYDGSYFEEVIELSEEEEEDDDDTDDADEKKVKMTPQDKNLPTSTHDQGLSKGPALSNSVVVEPHEESESYVEEEEEYIIEEFVEENYVVPLAGSETETEEDHGEDETSFDDNSTAYDPDDNEPIITDEARHRQSTSTELEIGKYSDHSMDVDNAFELTLPFIPKSKQMSAVTLDWDFYQDSTSSWGAWGSDEGSAEGNDGMGEGEPLTRPIIFMDENILETEGGIKKDGPQRGVARNKSTGKLVRRPSLQKTHSGGFQPRGSLSRSNSGNLRGGIDRTHSGGLIRPMPASLASTGIPRRKSHGHLIISSPLDTLTEDIKEEGGTQLSPVVNPEDHTKLSRDNVTISDSIQLPLPPPPSSSTESDNSHGSSQEFGDEAHESSERKATISVPQNKEHGEKMSTELLTNNKHVPADQENNDGELLPNGDPDSTTSPYAVIENSLQHEIHQKPLAENPTYDNVSNTGEGVHRNTNSTLEEDAPPAITLNGTLNHGNGDNKKDADGTDLVNTDHRLTINPNSITHVTAPFQSPTTKAGAQNPVTPSPSRPYLSPEQGMKKSRSIDQLRRSNHLNLPGYSNHSHLSLPRRASKRNGNSSSPGLNSQISSPKSGKVSRFEQLLKRSSAIKAVR